MLQIPLPTPHAVPVSALQAYDIPLGVFGSVAAALLVYNTFLHSCGQPSLPVGLLVKFWHWLKPEEDPPSRFSRWWNSLRDGYKNQNLQKTLAVWNAFNIITSLGLSLVAPVQTLIEQPDGLLVTLAILTTVGHILKTLSSFVGLAMKGWIGMFTSDNKKWGRHHRLFRVFAQVLADVANFELFAYGVLYVFKISVKGSHAPLATTHRVKLAGRYITVIGGIMQLPMVLMWISRIWCRVIPDVSDLSKSTLEPQPATAPTEVITLQNLTHKNGNGQFVPRDNRVHRRSQSTQPPPSPRDNSTHRSSQSSQRPPSLPPRPIAALAHAPAQEVVHVPVARRRVSRFHAWLWFISRASAAIGALATYCIGLVGLAFAAGDIIGISTHSVGRTVKILYMAGSAVLTLANLGLPSWEQGFEDYAAGLTVPDVVIG